MSDSSSSSSDASSSTVLKSICMTGRYGMPWKDLSPQIEKKIRHVRFRFFVFFRCWYYYVYNNYIYIVMHTMPFENISNSVSLSL